MHSAKKSDVHALNQSKQKETLGRVARYITADIEQSGEHVRTEQGSKIVLYKPVFAALHEGVTKFGFCSRLIGLWNSYSDGEKEKKKKKETRHEEARSRSL